MIVFIILKRFDSVCCHTSWYASYGSEYLAWQCNSQFRYQWICFKSSYPETSRGGSTLMRRMNHKIMTELGMKWRKQCGRDLRSRLICLKVLYSPPHDEVSESDKDMMLPSASSATTTNWSLYRQETQRDRELIVSVTWKRRKTRDNGLAS